MERESTGIEVRRAAGWRVLSPARPSSGRVPRTSAPTPTVCLVSNAGTSTAGAPAGIWVLDQKVGVDGAMGGWADYGALAAGTRRCGPEARRRLLSVFDAAN